MALSCPSCGSENTQKLSLLVNAGTVNSQSSTTGAVLVGGHIGLVGANTRSKNQSALAQQFGPPKVQTGLGCAVFFGATVLASIVTAIFQYTEVFFSVFAIVMVAGLWKSRKVQQGQALQHEKDVIQWHRKFACLRCGYTFIPLDGDESASPQLSNDQLWAVIIQSKGPRSAQFIKTLRELRGFSIAEAMQFADSLPKEIGRGLSRHEAEKLRGKFENIGAICELFPVRFSSDVIEVAAIPVRENEKTEPDDPDQSAVSKDLGGLVPEQTVETPGKVFETSRAHVGAAPKTLSDFLPTREGGTESKEQGNDGSELIGLIVIGGAALIAVCFYFAYVFRSPSHDAPTNIAAVVQPAIVTPSFDCTKVTAAVLKQICSNPQLALLDRQLSEAYKAAKSHAADPVGLLRSERAWIQQRNNSAADVTRLRELYRDRIAELRAPPAPVVQTGLPFAIGQCVETTVSKVSTRLEDGQGNAEPGSGSEVDFTNGSHQVLYDQLPAMDRSQPGDSVQMCLTSMPQDCPPGDNRGRTYHVLNRRTGESWDAPDSEHQCGGA